MKKTFISVIVVLAMLFALSVPAFAAVEGKLSAKVNISADGKTATVTLSVNNNSGFIALQVQAKYDSKALKLKSAENGKVFDSIFSASQNLTDNPYQIIFMDAFAEQDIKTNGVLATYTFEILKSGSNITFEVVDVANLNGETENKFNTCTVKVGGSANSGQADTPTSNNSSASATDKNETVSDGSGNAIEAPDANQSGAEISGNDNFDTTTDDQQTPNDELADADDLADTKNPATTVIIVVAVVLVLGAAAFLIVYFKKKSGK
ncbi:MAG: hypothetical protein IJD71_05355 [Clostridia bacterium]|nr:hypothetical protein [Clostridia bacterium]MBQ9920120.1 hypothetical protein [Clostridia bacterium]